ncbi:hypothetical protein LAUMK142_02217 [Mycobacterium pseudokansasii]|uniref:Uncharacterized protein n=1 Tax=Mycobacterium pseudokansasii TaxID=2341080 RepID=A0A498QVC6_9MYCO|nr:hypothetical protein LAUMK142_02217 [Mycobacterium pseudokansasii]
MPATLSQIRAWSTEHLIDAAGYWTQTADQWEDVFLQMRNPSYAIAWNGAGGDALRERTSADLPIVAAKADQLRQAAAVARNGASEISAAQQRVLYAVEDAQNAGFTVGEDLSVTDTRVGSTTAEQAARQPRRRLSPVTSACAQNSSTRQRSRLQANLPPPPLVSVASALRSSRSPTLSRKLRPPTAMESSWLTSNRTAAVTHLHLRRGTLPTERPPSPRLFRSTSRS